jgi:hypothetical protein
MKLPVPSLLVSSLLDIGISVTLEGAVDMAQSIQCSSNAAKVHTRVGSIVINLWMEGMPTLGNSVGGGDDSWGMYIWTWGNKGKERIGVK